MRMLPSDVNPDNIMLCDLVYHNPSKENDYVDYLSIVYKELDSGKKHVHMIENPTMDIYFTKDEYRNYDYNKEFIELEKVEKREVPYTKILWEIAKEAGPDYLNYLKQCVETQNRRRMPEVHKYKYVFGSDIPIESFYRTNWLFNYDNDKPKPLTKMFLDIEVDSINIPGFPKPGECPVNAVSIVDDSENTVYVLLLNNPKNPQIKEFVDNIDDFIDELHELFDESYGILSYKIFMYDDEKELLKAIFNLVNTLKRDFCAIWNISFDIPFLIQRMINLGMDYKDIMCHPDFKVKTCFFRKDNQNFKVAEKGDYFKLSSYTKFIDQMIVYAGIRKSQSELRSNALNYIGQLELKDEKLDYSEEANIKTLPYVNYKKFVAYNIKD